MFYNILELSVGLLGSDAEWTCRKIPRFWRNMLPPFSALKMEALCSSEILVSDFKSIWHY
jgi:hypothetical protein